MTSTTKLQVIKFFVIMGIVVVHLMLFSLFENIVVYRELPQRSQHFVRTI
jgi:hypothetical protein